MGLREDFLRDGFVAIEDALDSHFCDEVVRSGFRRLGAEASDPTTWPAGWRSLPPVRVFDLVEVAPAAETALHALLGGPQAIAFEGIPDNLIFNFPDEEATWFPPESWRSAGAGYHKDGDWFRHFLDSPEQGILGVVFWSDVTERQGATYVALDSIRPVAELLARHPEGLDPSELRVAPLLAECRRFRALTGRRGTIVWAHPFLLHSASVNATDRPRIISNTAVMLREPMQLDRGDGSYTAVEEAVLRALDVPRVAFRAAAERARIVPERELQWQRESDGSSADGSDAKHDDTSQNGTGGGDQVQ